MEIAIIGGGASGMMCAVSLLRKNKNVSVTVYEKMSRPLKKILVTGNGRCNLTNINSGLEFYRGDSAFAERALLKYPPESNMGFFKKLGLITEVGSEGRVYPLSRQSQSVVNALVCEAQRLGVKTVCDTEITSVRKEKEKFVLNGVFKSNFLIISAGGSASPKHGTDGGSFRLLSSLGVNVITPSPALTSVIAERFTKSLKGVRHICSVRLLIDEKEAYCEKGEVQFTDYGLSGIPIMQLSGLVSVSESKNVCVILDCAPLLDVSQLKDFFLSRKGNNPRERMQNVITGVLPAALGNHLMLLIGIKKDSEIGQVDSRRLFLLAEKIKRFRMNVKGVRGFDFAQVTAGGADTREFNPETLECKKIKGLYCTGEALNIYGMCGGYNLQWAWSGARTAADAILKELEN